MADPILTQFCPECGNPLAAGVLQGMCPYCLMAAAAHETEPTVSRTAAVAPEQVAGVFPQLEIVELIGQGGMGAVFKVRQPKLDRFAALKLLPQSLAADPAFAGRFEREARLLARLSHPNIVSVYDYGQAGEFFYLLMEYVDGVNLRQAMRASRFEPQQALAIVPKICEALQYAHDEGVLHRDIKPENILLDTRGRVKLVDFGIAKLVAESEAFPIAAPAAGATYTQAGVALGTPDYMAPEQRRDPTDVDNRADIYSLGVVFYELLTGELPTEPIARPSEKSNADPRVDAIVQQALEGERDRRQGSANQVRTQVQTLTAHLGLPDNAASQRPYRGRVSGFPRLSRLAVIGGCWAPLFFVAWIICYAENFDSPYPLLTGWNWVWLALLALGALAPFGATILGWIAVAQIRHSAGRLFGLGLAVFDGLLFPLLLLDAAFLVASFLVVDTFPNSFWSHFGPLAGKFAVLALTILTSAIADFWIVRRVWNSLRIERGPMNFTSRPPAKLPLTPASSLSNPRFSILAFLGACSPLPLIFLMAVQYRYWQIMSLMADYQNSGQARPTINLPIWVQHCAVPAWLLAIFGTTMFGLAAMVHIRLCRGKIFGLAIALFAALAYPLLYLDLAIIAGFKQFAFELIFRGYSGPGSSYGERADYDATNFLAIATGIVVDFLIVQIVWRLINKPRDPSATPLKRESGNPRLAGVAMMVSGTAGMLGIMIWSMLGPSETLVWSILVAAIVGVVLAAPNYKTLLGKQALRFGIGISAIWLAVFTIRNLIPASSISGSTASAAGSPIGVMTAVAVKGDLPIYLYEPGEVSLSDATGPTSHPAQNPASIAVLFSIKTPEDVRVLAKRLDAQIPLSVDIFTPGGDRKIATGLLVGANTKRDLPSPRMRMWADVSPIGDAQLNPNDSVQVALILETKHDVVLVPRSAVFSRHALNAGNDCFVHVIQPDHAVLTRGVNIGLAEARQIEITGGLSPGEIVVTYGTDQLRDGTLVRSLQSPEPNSQ